MNLTNCLLLVGTVGLLAVCHLPYAVGGELALLERDAVAVVRALVATGAEGAAALAAPADAPARAALLTGIHERCRLYGVLPPDLPQPIRQSATAITFGTQDYLYLMARVPPPVDGSTPDSDAIEAWAWPRALDARVRTAFCGSPAGITFTRNLTNRYRGPERPPEPGTAHGHKKRENRDEYWGADGQYWRPQPE